MPGDAVFIDQINEIPLGKTRECRLTKMRILAQISARFDIKVALLNKSDFG
ncbi:hypothetical protein AC96_3940 [Escherichia coli 2-156-04_S4_C2]|nr:hypothetical protein AC96_3940 [Escherichia coli 2-156-04_S4_C2]